MKQNNVYVDFEALITSLNPGIIFVDGVAFSGSFAVAEKLALRKDWRLYEPTGANGAQLPGLLDAPQAYFWALDLARAIDIQFVVHPVSLAQWNDPVLRLETWGAMLSEAGATLIVVHPEERNYRNQIAKAGHGRSVDGLLMERNRLRLMAAALPAKVVRWYSPAQD